MSKMSFEANGLTVNTYDSHVSANFHSDRRESDIRAKFQETQVAGSTLRSIWIESLNPASNDELQTMFTLWFTVEQAEAARDALTKALRAARK